MIFERPLFLDNPEWYVFDEKQWRYVLTDKATDEARKSYNAFYDAEEELLYGNR